MLKILILIQTCLLIAAGVAMYRNTMLAEKLSEEREKQSTYGQDLERNYGSKFDSMSDDEKVEMIIALLHRLKNLTESNNLLSNEIRELGEACEVEANTSQKVFD